MSRETELSEPPPSPTKTSIVRAYEPPTLVDLGAVHDVTLGLRGRCFWGKKWGGTDGLEFMGMSVPVSSC
jgi:hypothetical protein